MFLSECVGEAHSHVEITLREVPHGINVEIFKEAATLQQLTETNIGSEKQLTPLAN